MINKIKKMFQRVTVVLVIVFMATPNITVMADTTAHTVGIRVVDHNILDESNPGTMETIASGSLLKAGQIIRVDIQLTVPTTPSAYSLMVNLQFDSEMFTPLKVETDYIAETSVSTKKTTDYAGVAGIFPVKSAISSDTNWSGTIAFQSDGKSVNIAAKDSQGSAGKPLAASGTLGSIFFTVKENVTVGHQGFFYIGTTTQFVSSSNTALTYTSDYTTANRLIYKMEGEQPSFNGTLASLSLTANSHNYMEDKFDAAKETYSTSDGLVVPNQVSSIVLNATTVDTTSGLTITYGKKNVTGSNATQTLDVGDNELYVVVTSSGGQEKVYTLHVKRLSASASITAVSGTYGSSTLVFDGSYKGNVPSNTSTVKILASIVGASTSITSGEVALVDNNLPIAGETTTFVVAVTPENALSQYASVYGNTPGAIVSRTYTVTRQNGDSSISSLVIDGTNYYSAGKTSYTVPVASGATTSSVVFTTTNSKATIELYASPHTFTVNLGTGNTTVTYNVRAEDGSSTNYTIIFERQKDTNTDLSALSAVVNGQSLLTNFSPSVTSYNLGEIAYVENGKWSVAATKASTKASLTGTVNDKALVVGLNTINVEVTAENGSKKTYVVTVTMKANANAIIGDNIKIGDNPADYVGIIDGSHLYRIDVPYSKTQISMSDFNLTLPTGAQVTLNEGTKALQVGENTYQFTVTAADGSTTETYRVIVNRLASTNALLSGLTITGNLGGTLSPANFSSTTTNYTYSVPANTASYTVSATAQEDGTVTASGLGSFTLSGSSYTHKVVVTSQDGSTSKEYTIQINREKSNVNTLSALTLNANDVLSSMVNRQVSVHVNADVTSAVFDYQLTDSRSTATINGSASKTFTLNYGENVFNVSVTAENNTSLVYQVTVIRDRSQETRLTSLTINGNSAPGFASDTYTYTLPDVSHETNSLTVAGIPVDSEATVSVGGTSLVDGLNTILVTVTAADGVTKQVYTIKVTRLKSNSSAILSIAPTTAATTAGHTITKIDETHYQVEVPYGTATYSQSAFNLNVLTGSTIDYQATPTTITGQESPTFTFSVTSPLGQSTTTYTLSIVVKESVYPLLNGVSINGHALANFDRDTFNQPAINADSYLENQSTALLIDLSVDEGVVITGGSQQTVNVAGKLSSTLSVILTKNGYVSTYTFTFTHQLSNDASLASLTTNQGTLTPTLADSPNGPFEITVGAAVTNITFSATPTHSAAKLTGLGPYTDLKPGKNIKTIYVTPEDGSQAKAYSIVVYREMALQSLSIGSTVVDLSSGTLAQGVLTLNVSNLPASASTALVSATANDSSVVLSGEVNKSVAIAAGNDTLNFTLTAQDGTTKLNVVVNTQRTASSDPRLASLNVTIDGQSFVEIFSSDSEDYTLNLPYSVDIFDPSTDLSWTTVHENTIVSTSNAIALKDTETNLVTVTGKAEDGSEKTYNIRITKAGYNYLSSLSVGQGEGILNQTFKPETLNYTATIYPNIETFRIYYTVDTARYPGTYIENEAELSQLNVSDLPKTVDVIVVASNGEKRTYTIAIDTGLSARLSSLTPSVGSIEFNANTENYQITVEEEVTSISFTAVAEDAKATISGQYTNVALTKEETDVSIVVKNGNYEKTYKVKVIRKINESALESIEIRKDNQTWSPIYNEQDKSYSVDIPKGTDLSGLEVITTSVGSQTTVVVNGPQVISDHEVRYEIVSTDKHGNTTTNELIVRHEVSDNNYLKSLTYEGNSLEGFVKTKLDYTLEIHDENPFTINALPEDDAATLNITYPETFRDGEQIVVDVTSEQGNIRQYTITLKRVLSQTALLESLMAEEVAFSSEFSPLKTDYYAEVNPSVTSLTIRAVAVGNATVEIIGADSLTAQNNVIEVIVTAESGNTTTYYIHVTKTVALDNPIESLKVIGNVHGDLALTPGFNAVERNYVVELERDETTVDIQVDVKEGLRVTGDGETTITQAQEVREVKVFNSSNEFEVYYITFKQKPSDNASLANLWTDQGYFDQVFNRDTTGYTLSVDADVDQIELLYTLSEQAQSVDGAGVKTLVSGRNRFVVTVTAEDKSTKTYTVTIIRGTASGAQLTDLTVSEGELSPKFKASTHTYYVQVDDTTDAITIGATASESATITGTGTVALVPGANAFDVQVSEDGQTSTYTVVVLRGEVESVYLARFSLEGYDSNETFEKTHFDYTVDIYGSASIKPKVIAVAEDPNATVTIDAPEEINQGQYVIKATVSLPKGQSQVYTLTVDSFIYKIRSDIHEVGETYILSIRELQTVSQVKEQMLNEASTLQIFFNGTALADTDLVPSGAIIKLIVNEVTYDQKTLIVRGDANQDGRIGAGDVQVALTYILGTNHNEIATLTADVNRDERIGSGDVVAIRSHILKTSNLYEEGEE